MEGRVDELLNIVPGTHAGVDVFARSRATSLNPLDSLESYIPNSVIQPFAENNVLAIVLLALIFGAALRRVRTHPDAGDNVHALARGIEAIYQMRVQMLAWIIQAVPFAVLGVIAQVVGKSGVSIFSALSISSPPCCSGLGVHSLVYYPLVAWLVGKKPPKVYVGQGADAIVTAVSCNSSLATVPVTLRCLDRVKICTQSSRLAACVGTNFNNDGITLYEAMAALFLAQALGYDLPMMNQLVIVAASIMAGAGVAGIPEAGLVVLPLVLSAAGLADHLITGPRCLSS